MVFYRLVIWLMIFVRHNMHIHALFHIHTSNEVNESVNKIDNKQDFSNLVFIFHFYILEWRLDEMMRK